ncbi:MAG: mechanosensitive ion channel family protein [Acidobacteriota bacterium]|nr:mechanosensitive ion channel family protein [Acidobacteriota bacterium]
MEIVQKMLPSAATILTVVLTLFLVQRFMDRPAAARRGHQFRNQLILLGLTAAGLLLIVLVVPIGDAMRGQLLGLVGIVSSAAIALSSTTFLGNAMAGVMLRSVKNFKMGDFISSGEHFGRVSERGLFHTEIQTADRDLTTVPNMFLVTHPVTTVRASGTIVSTTVSLGYDVSRVHVEKLLLEAARSVDLQEPFVHIKELGDFSVVYRIHGLLTEVKRVLSVRSQLRCAVLDHLHEGGVEIVSPNFMNQRVLADQAVFIPRPTRASADETQAVIAETVVFDKADEAESIEELRNARTGIKKELAKLNESMKESDADEKKRLEGEISILKLRMERFDKMIANRETRADDGD